MKTIKLNNGEEGTKTLFKKSKEKIEELNFGQKKNLET
jgi:hypothetical protein